MEAKSSQAEAKWELRGLGQPPEGIYKFATELKEKRHTFMISNISELGYVPNPQAQSLRLVRDRPDHVPSEC